jgi:Flp pilus assembly protein TadD
MGVVVTAAACGSERGEESTATVGAAPQVSGAGTVEAPVTQASSDLSAGASVPIAAAVDSGVSTVGMSNVTYGDAERVFRTGDFAKATAMFEAYTVRMPANPWGHYMVGISAWRAGEHARAEGALRRTVEVDPKHTKGLTNLARVLLEQRKASDALDFAMKVVELAPENGEGWRVLGNAHTELHMHEAAANAYKKAIAIDPEDAWTMNNLGLLRIQQGEYMAALYPLARATELAPDVATFQNNLGVALERAGYVSQAAEAYRTALAADEKYERARVSLERVSPRVPTTPEAPVDLTALAADFVQEVVRWQAEGKDVREERDDLPGGYDPGR